MPKWEAFAQQQVDVHQGTPDLKRTVFLWFVHNSDPATDGYGSRVSICIFCHLSASFLVQTCSSNLSGWGFGHPKRSYPLCLVQSLFEVTHHNSDQLCLSLTIQHFHLVSLNSYTASVLLPSAQTTKVNKAVGAVGWLPDNEEMNEQHICPSSTHLSPSHTVN